MTISAVVERGSAISATSSTTVGGSPTANIVVGRYAFCLCVTDNTSTPNGASTDHTSVTDTDGHTWIKLYEYTHGRGVIAAGSTQSLWMTKVTTQIDTSDTITLTMGTARVAKVICFAECQITTGSTLQLAAIGVSSHQLFGQAATTVSAVVSGLISKPYLLIGCLGAEGGNPSWTEDADYTNVMASEGVTNGGTGLINVCAYWGTRIATLTGDTFAPALASGADMVGSLVALEEVQGIIEGGSEATINVDADGGGIVYAEGGSVATVEVSASGGGAPYVEGGASATIEVSASGGGIQYAEGGSVVTVEVSVSGDGIQYYEGGASVTIEVTASGDGGQYSEGGSEATVEVMAYGGGEQVPLTESGSVATINVTASGDGFQLQEEEGGSESLVEVSALGGGAEIIQGGGVATIEVAATGAGTQHGPAMIVEKGSWISYRKLN